MRKSDELTNYYGLINSLDRADAVNNEVMIWVNDTGKYEVDLTVFGKSAKARLYVEENEKCGLILFDNLQQYDTEIPVEGDLDVLAKRVIAYLKNPEDQF